MKQIVFITGNLNKVKYTNKFINYKFEHQKIDLEEIQSLDVIKVIEHKVKQAYQIIKAPVLVEDTSVVIHAFGNLPGTFVRFFFEEVGNDGVCKMLAEFPDRSATITVCFGFFDGTILKTFIGVTQGSVAKKPRGTNGFGFNPIFIPQGSNKTSGELTDDEFEVFNPRKKALIKLDKFLKLKKYY